MLSSILVCVVSLIGQETCAEGDDFKKQRDTLPAAIKGFEQALKDGKYEEIFDKWLDPGQAKDARDNGLRDEFIKAVRTKQKLLIRVVEECKKVTPTVEEFPLWGKGSVRAKFQFEKPIDDEFSHQYFHWQNGKWFFVD